MPSRHVKRDIMKASFSTTTTFLIVAFGMMTFIFFGIHTFSSITYSANVVAENIEYLNAIDAAHLIKACLKGSDGIITWTDVGSFNPSDCNFPGLSEIDYEYKIFDLHEGVTRVKSSGFDDEGSKISHAIFLNIAMDNGDVHVGRLYVQTG